MDLTRPSPKETEESILHSQQEFLSKKFKPCAEVVNKRKSHSGSLEETKRLKHQNIEGGSTSQNAEDSETEFSQIDNHDMKSAEVLLDVQERDNAKVVAKPPEAPSEPASFPESFICSKSLKPQGKNKKKSIFAQQMEKKQRIVIKPSGSQLPPISSDITKGSYILDGSGLKSNEETMEIHKDNLSKLERMSKEEILAHQKKLLKQLDPNIVKFLQKKREIDRNESSLSSANEISVRSQEISMDVDTKQCQEKGISTGNMAKITSNIAEMDVTVKLAEENKWIHMDVVEKEKLTWTGDLSPPKPIDLKTGYPARFDFKGNIVVRDDEISVKEGLHHHGDEQEAPGYTVEDLFLISRSSFHSQSIIALQTLAAIMQKNQQGLYDECFESMLMQQLLDAGIVPLLRWALDENSESQFSAALLAIRNLIFDECDEVCLDKVFSWKGGYIAPFMEPLEESKDEETKPEEMTDIQIVKLDVIKGFLRKIKFLN